MLFSCFLKEIQSDNFIKRGDRVLAAVSGGADSVCLLHLLSRLRSIHDFELVCAHVHHGLREEADADAAFVQALCNDWEIPFLLHKVDVGRLAKENKISIELAGREARYTFFKTVDANVIVTAHTKNDVAETVLLHMIRGCGLSGLCGIPRMREDGIYRPLLNFSREHILKYLTEHKLTWREDKSNQDLIYARNRVRHKILPAILEMNPAFLDTVSRMSEILTDENRLLQDWTKRYNCMMYADGVWRLSTDDLAQMPYALQKRAISGVVESAEDVRQVLALCDRETGKRISLSGGKTAEKAYGEILLYEKKPPIPAAIKLPDCGTVSFGPYRITVGKEGLALPQKEYWVRARKDGDVFSPEGLIGHKKIKDFLSEKKVPHFYRGQVPIIVHNDKIAAVADWRRDNEFLPHGEKTIRIQIQRM